MEVFLTYPIPRRAARVFGYPGTRAGTEVSFPFSEPCYLG